MDVVGFGGCPECATAEKASLSDDSVAMTIKAFTDTDGDDKTKIIVAAAAVGGVVLLLYMLFKGA